MSETQNPLLAKLKIPGRTYQLPSKGALYNNGELDTSVTDGEIHVYPMSALVEINLKTPDLLFNGKAIEAVMAECVPSIKKPMELYGRDIDAILFFLRLTTYGSEFRVEVTHDCKEAKKHSYAVNLETLLQQMQFLDPTMIEQKRRVTLPSGLTVYTRPLKFSAVIDLYHKHAKKQEMTVDLIKDLTIFNLMNVIDRVDDVTDRKFIEEWVRTLTMPEINRITEVSNDLNKWGPDRIVKLKCKDCGEEMTVELPLDPVSFFTE